MHHLLDEVRADGSISVDFNLLEAWPFVNSLRSHVRFVMAHESKVMSRMQVQVIMVSFIVGMLGAHMSVHLNGSRVDWDQVAIMMSCMRIMIGMNLVSMNVDRVDRRFDWLIWRVSIFLRITQFRMSFTDR